MNRTRDVWTKEQDARLTELWSTGLIARKIAIQINVEFDTTFSVWAILGRKQRLKLPDRPSCAKMPKPHATRTWTAEQRHVQAERLKRYWKDRADGVHPREQVPPEKFETIEQFLARGGAIQRFEPRPDDYPAGVPVYPTNGRRYGAAP